MNCPYCNHDEAILYGSKLDLRYWRCRKCRKFFEDDNPIVDDGKPLPQTYSLGYVIGVLTGDGSLLRWRETRHYGANLREVAKSKATKHILRYRYGFQLGVKDEDFAIEFAKHLKNVTGKETHPYPITKKSRTTVNLKPVPYTYHGFKVQLRSKEWYYRIKPLQTDLDWIKAANKQVKLGFIRGMYDSEGGRFKSKYRTSIHLTSKDVRLVRLVRELLAEFGIQTHKINARKDGCFRLNFCRSEMVRLFDERIGFSIERKK